MKFSESGLKEILSGLQLRAGKVKQVSAALTKLGKEEIYAAQIRIALTKMSPEGTPWTPWSEATKIARERDGTADTGLLYRSGALYNSFQLAINNNQVVVKNVAPYAQMLQDGTPKMPARPFFGWSEESKQRITVIFGDFLDKTVIKGEDYTG